jgi:hypothetical protein
MSVKNTSDDVPVLLCIFNILEISYNQPKLSACAQWDTHAISFANEEVLDPMPLNIFVDRKNIVYLTSNGIGQVHMWIPGNNTRKTITLERYFQPAGFFYTIDESIYISHDMRGTVQKWGLNGTKHNVVMNFDDFCYALFVDINNFLYCSMYYEHRVVKQSLNVDANISIVVAGTSTAGAASNMLDSPSGIFVDINFDLYVADSWNHRIQLFKVNQLNGTTVAGYNSIPSIDLHQPNAVFLDADHYLFIVDYGYSRIIGSRSNGFFCVLGCSGVSGSESDYLNYPTTAAFDNYGNIFVSDHQNTRIQKLNLLTNSFGK